MNDLDLCLEVMSTIALCWISRKPLEIETWFQSTTNRIWHMGYQMVTWRDQVTWPITSRDPQRCCEAVRSAILATAWLLVWNKNPAEKVNNSECSGVNYDKRSEVENVSDVSCSSNCRVVTVGSVTVGQVAVWDVFVVKDLLVGRQWIVVGCYCVAVTRWV